MESTIIIAIGITISAMFALVIMYVKRMDKRICEKLENNRKQLVYLTGVTVECNHDVMAYLKRDEPGE